MRSVRCIAALLALSALPIVAWGAAVKTPQVEAELVAAKTALVPHATVPVAVRLKMEPGWHTYWQNPGDSGLPTRVAWKLPAGVMAGPIQWPAPLAVPVGPLMNHGYEGEILLVSELHSSIAPSGGDPLTIAAHVDWLVCKDICIPDGADVSLTLPAAASATADPRWAQPIAAAVAAVPKPLEGWQIAAQGKGANVELKLTPPAQVASAALTDLHFFPYTENQIEPAAPQVERREGDGYVLTLPVASTMTNGFARVAGVITAGSSFGSGVRAATIDVPLAGAVAVSAKPAGAAAPQLNLGAGAQTQSDAGGTAALPAGSHLTLLAAVLFAFAGGVLLNLMPCVFPVLSIKVLGFATHHDSKALMRREGAAFAAGVVLTFVALGLVLAALRAAGEQLGWGFQLQSPAVVTALAILFFVLALNLTGVFEFGQLVPSGLASWSSHNRTVDAFGSGVLVVVIASPCTAPFMGAALGYALSSSAWITLAVFVALGVGMALPYVLLAWFPAWRKRLPRPGAWLARFKQLLAFPLYATVIWLAWVLGSQRDNDSVLRLFAVLLGISFALWAWHIVRSGGGRRWAIAGLAVLAITAVLSWPLLSADADALAAARDKTADLKPMSLSSKPGEWADFTPDGVQAMTRAGRAVFVDFTAAWCVTCQVNKRLVLNTADVRRAFADKDVVLVRADWTRRDPAITQALTSLGRNGVPAYVLYRPGKEPLLLPEVLQDRYVLDALATL